MTDASTTPNQALARGLRRLADEVEGGVSRESTARWLVRNNLIGPAIISAVRSEEHASWLGSVEQK